MQNSTSQIPTRVLIVEDEFPVAIDTQERLEALGLDVLGTARTGLSALAIAHNEPLDLVIMDVNLRGGMDGAETALLLRQKYDIPCIFLTAYSDDKTLGRCTPSSPLGYIIKPYDERAFALTIALAQQQLTLKKERDVAYRDRDLANARYSHILLHSVDAVLSFDENLVITVFNRAAEKAFGWSEREAIGHPLSSLIPKFLQANQQKVLRHFTPSTDALLSDGARRRVVARRKNGEEFPAEVLLSKSPSSNDSCLTALIRDLSEEERLRSQFIQAQKMEAVGLLGVHVAHDFNNLLLGLRAYLYLLRKDAKASQLNYLDECDLALSRGAGLTHNLTTLARPDSTNEKIFNAATAIEETLRFAAALLPRRISFDYQGAPPDCRVKMNHGRFEQALVNLMINARDAISGQGTITISASTENLDAVPYLRIVVSDAGCGMSEIVARQAFKPFYTTKPPGLGTGLGLPSVRGIVESAGGKIDLSSQESVGTQVTIRLPLVGLPDTPTEAESGYLRVPTTT